MHVVVDLLPCMLLDDVTCLHVKRNILVRASYLDIEDYDWIIIKRMHYHASCKSTTTQLHHSWISFFTDLLNVVFFFARNLVKRVDAYASVCMHS